MATIPQPLPFTPPPQVQKNAAGQMLDSQGKPIPQAPAISPDGTSIATGDQGLIWNASGPKMTPPSQPAAAAPTTPSPDTSSGEGIFSRIGNFLTQRGPAIGDIANHLAAGAGNYRPLQAAEQEKELGLKQQSEDLQGKLAQSSMDTQALNRQHLSQEIANTRTPEQSAQANLDVQKKLEQQKNALGAPKDIVAANPEGSGMQHYNETFNPDTNQWEIKPTMVGGKPLTAVGKSSGGWELTPDPQSPTGYSQVATDVTGHEIGRRSGAIPPAALIPKDTEGSTTGLKDDGHGHQVAVTLPHSSRTTPKLPGLADPSQITVSPGIGSGGAPPPQTKPQVPGGSKNSGGVHVGPPVLDSKAPPAVVDAFKTYSQSQERFAVMQDALPKGMAGDQQAQLNLLANHLGMTMGLQKGARLNQAIIQEAQQSTPWLQGLQAKFGPDGYMTGVTLTPQQMKSMLDLAKVRVDADAQNLKRMQVGAQNNFSADPTAPAADAPPASGFKNWKASQVPSTMPRVQ